MATSIDVAQALQDGICTLQPNGKYLCVCNTELLKPSIKRHLASKRHLERLQALQDGMCTLQPNGKYLCVCNAELMKTSIKKHLTSKKHLEKVSRQAVRGPSRPEKDSNTNHLDKTRKMTYSMLAPQSEVAQALQDGTLTLQPNGKYLCVCKSEIVKSSINKHLASAKHKMVTQKLLEETKNRSDEKQALQDGTCTLQPNGKYLCVCNAELVKASIKKHLTSNKHLEKVSRQAVRGPSRPGKDSNTNHLEKTRKMTHSMLAPQSEVAQALQDGTLTLQSNGKYLCVCKSEIVKSSINKHLASAKHKEMAAPHMRSRTAREETTGSEGKLSLNEMQRHRPNYAKKEESRKSETREPCPVEEGDSDTGDSEEEEGLSQGEDEDINQEKENEEISQEEEEQRQEEEEEEQSQEEEEEEQSQEEEEEEQSQEEEEEEQSQAEEEEEQSQEEEEEEQSQEEEEEEQSQEEEEEEQSQEEEEEEQSQEEEEEENEEEFHLKQQWTKYSKKEEEELSKEKKKKEDPHLTQPWDPEDIEEEEDSELSGEKSQQSKGGDILSLSTSTEPYRMASQPRGNVYIFNYKFTGKHNYRSGAEHDSETIQATFTNMGYRVFTKEDLSRRATLMELKLIRDEESTRDVDSMIMFILSHGKGVRDFLTEDGLSLCLSRIHQMFTDAQCPALRGKPKIFFTNFCRKGVFETCPVFESSDPPRDMVTIHAAGEGIDALRNTAFGTYFIRNLCQVLQEHAGEKSLREIYLELDRSAAERGGTQPMWEDFVFRNFYFSPTKSNTKTSGMKRDDNCR